MLILFWEDKKSGATESVRFDVISSESHESILTITSHPVEEGSDVTDHARLEPERLTIEGYVSNKPSFSNPGVEDVMSQQTVSIAPPKSISEESVGPQTVAPIFTPGGAGRALSGAVAGLFGATKPTSIQVLKASGEWVDRARAMYDKLKKAQTDRARISVNATKVQNLKDMLIERLAVPRTTSDGNGLLFQIDLIRVRIVSTETVEAPDPAELRGVKQTSLGSQATKAADNDAKKLAQQKTLAAAGWDGAADFARGLLRPPL